MCRSFPRLPLQCDIDCQRLEGFSAEQSPQLPSYRPSQEKVCVNIDKQPEKYELSHSELMTCLK